MIRISRSIVPNFFTVGNMFCGYMSIVFASYYKDINLAAWTIILAAFLDAIDGKIARLTGSSSKFGVEYDSLADVVSFGAAPSVLIYEFHFLNLQTIGLLISFFPLLFGSIRLARFNVQLSGFTKNHFNGLPIPASAISFASYILFVRYFFPERVFPRFLLILTIVVCLLMVSTVRYEVFPALSLRGTTRQKIIFGGFVVIGLLILIFPQPVIFPLMMIYVASGLIFSVFYKNSNTKTEVKDELDEPE